MAMDDNEKYPNTYRWWSAAQIADTAMNFIIEMDWKSVAVISDSMEFDLQVRFSLENHLFK